MTSEPLLAAVKTEEIPSILWVPVVDGDRGYISALKQLYSAVFPLHDSESSGPPWPSLIYLPHWPRSPEASATPGPPGTWFLISQPRPFLQLFLHRAMDSSLKADAPLDFRCSHFSGSSVTYLPVAMGHNESCGEAGCNAGIPPRCLTNHLLPHANEIPLLQFSYWIEKIILVQYFFSNISQKPGLHLKSQAFEAFFLWLCFRSNGNLKHSGL